MINSGSYIMWFTRYGWPEMRCEATIEDCYDLAWMLDEADTSVFDQYGILGAVEHVGHGIISDPDWERGFDAHKARVTEERIATEESNPSPKPYGHIEIRSFDPLARKEGWARHSTQYSGEKLDVEVDRLRTLLGDDRVRAQVYKAAAS